MVWGAMIIIVGTILFNQSTGRLPTFDKMFSRRGPADDNRLPSVPTLADPDARADAGAPVLPGGPDKPVAGKELFGGAKPEWFLGLEDDSVFRRDENEAFFSLLKLLSNSQENDLRIASKGVRTFRQLYDQPDDYRGEIVTVYGTVRRVIPYTNNPPNEQGITKHYKVWITPHGVSTPIAAVCTEMPADYPSGEEVEAEITGFFYKRLKYASNTPGEFNRSTGQREEVFRSSPLILAKTLTWRRTTGATANQEATAEEEGPRLPLGIPRKYIFHVIGVGVLIMIMLSFWSYRLARTSVLSQGPIIGRRRREAEENPEPTDLNNLRF
jgi:hypothetical protein